jgi:hypothetical protein
MESIEKKKLWIEVVGWYGAVALVLAFTLTSFLILAPDSFWYQFLNLTGAIGIITVSLHKKNYQPFAVNVFWGIVALIALLKLL